MPKYFNSGMYLWADYFYDDVKKVRKIVEQTRELLPRGYPPGTCILNFEGVKKSVAKNEWVEIPFDAELGTGISPWSVRNACPSLLTEAEYAEREAAKKASK